MYKLFKKKSLSFIFVEQAYTPPPLLLWNAIINSLFFIVVEQAYTSPASLKCNGHFSCSEECQTAYTAGSDGCPQCDCVPGACLLMRTWNQKWTEHPCRCYVFISLVHCIPPLSNEPIFHISCPIQEHHLPIKSILTYMLYHLLSLCVAFCVSILRINNHIKPSV